MKKFIFVVYVTALGVLVLSCEADSVSEISLHNKKNNTITEDLTLKLQDSIPQNNYTTLSDGDGPGDEPLIIIPPKSPKK